MGRKRGLYIPIIPPQRPARFGIPVIVSVPPQGGSPWAEPADDIEREAIAEEEGDTEFIDYDMPDWDEEFFEEWEDEIDYEIFTVLS